MGDAKRKAPTAALKALLSENEIGAGAFPLIPIIHVAISRP